MGSYIDPVNLIFKNNVKHPYWVLWSGLGFWCLSPVVSVTALWTTAASPSTLPWSNSVDTHKYRQWCDNVQSGTLHPSWRHEGFLGRTRPVWHKVGPTALRQMDAQPCVRKNLCPDGLFVARWFLYCPLLPVCRMSSSTQLRQIHTWDKLTDLFGLKCFIKRWFCQ